MSFTDLDLLFPASASHVLDIFPLYFFGGERENTYFALMSHLHNPTSTTDVGYLEAQAGFRWESFGGTRRLHFVLELQLQPEAVVSSASSSISFPSSPAAEVRSRVKYGV